MSMMLRDPFEALTPLREAMNRLFEDSFVGPRFDLLTGRIFPIDVYETKDKRNFVIEAALPGVKPEELQVLAEDDTLTIRVAKKHEEKPEKGSYLRRERYEGEMYRTITLPVHIEIERVEAVFEHGVLKL
ncbi:MAG TPA: Hsp20/alpha crystallin family protein, partial [Ktedonobacteraceae bacterium]